RDQQGSGRNHHGWRSPIKSRPPDRGRSPRAEMRTEPPVAIQLLSRVSLRRFNPAPGGGPAIRLSTLFSHTYSHIRIFVYYRSIAAARKEESPRDAVYEVRIAATFARTFLWRRKQVNRTRRASSAGQSKRENRRCRRKTSPVRPQRAFTRPRCSTSSKPGRGRASSPGSSVCATRATNNTPR